MFVFYVPPFSSYTPPDSLFEMIFSLQEEKNYDLWTNGQYWKKVINHQYAKKYMYIFEMKCALNAWKRLEVILLFLF